MMEKKTIHFAWRNLKKLFLDKSIQFEYDLFRLLKAKYYVLDLTDP